MGKTIVSRDGCFEWDEVKDRLNRIKHGLGLAESIRVFEDPYMLEVYDESHSTEEERYIGIGSLQGELIIVVCHTNRRKRVRLYSARKATPKEERIYYEKIKAFNSETD